MLLTPLGTSAAAASQMPIGGQRYFVLAPFLPALHIFFELIDHSDTPESKRRIANRLLLIVQAILLFGALVVRNSTGYLLAALLCVSGLAALPRAKTTGRVDRAITRRGHPRCRVCILRRHRRRGVAGLPENRSLVRKFLASRIRDFVGKSRLAVRRPAYGL